MHVLAPGRAHPERKSIMATSNSFEQAALRDPDVKFGFDNYEVLRQVGDFVKEMRTGSSLTQAVLQEMSGVSQADISRLEKGAMERGPSLLTLVRLAHAAGKHLVIGLKDDAGDSKELTQVLTL
jgi:ribosome-binding protein aMBF1 (putative translation factor)